MLCSSCNSKDATVHWTQVVGDKVHKVDLCEECAKTKGLDDPAGKAMAGMLMGIGEEDEENKAAPSLGMTTADPVVCSVCGFTQDDFKKNMRFGCAACYNEFGVQLRGLIKTMHRGVKHVGKVPKDFERQHGFSIKHAELKEKLEAAISQEAFEEAARLRDEISELKMQSESSV